MDDSTAITIDLVIITALTMDLAITVIVVCWLMPAELLATSVNLALLIVASLILAVSARQFGLKTLISLISDSPFLVVDVN